MKKIRFGKCFACFAGYTDCCHNRKIRLPRKSKKKLKEYCSYVLYKQCQGRWMDISKCDIDKYYKDFKKNFHLINYVKSYFNKIELILKYGREDFSEGIYLTDKAKLGWYWEYDSDFGGSSGVMDFCYTKEAAGDTWAYSEMHDLWRTLYKGHKGGKLPEHIQSDIDLFKFIRQNPLPKYYLDEY